MNKFADFGIDPISEKNIYQVPKVSIEDIVNTEIEVLEYQPGVKTEYGDDRYVVKIRNAGAEQKFFTSASPIKEALDKIPPAKYPFTATIRLQKYGQGKKTYYFT